MNKKQMSLIGAYALGAFITNSYCRNCRWEEWDHSGTNARSLGVAAPFKTTAATALWPIYAASRACDAGVSYASNIELKWK